MPFVSSSLFSKVPSAALLHCCLEASGDCRNARHSLERPCAAAQRIVTQTTGGPSEAELAAEALVRCGGDFRSTNEYAIPVFPCEDDITRGKFLVPGSVTLNARARGTSVLGKFPGFVDRRVLKPGEQRDEKSAKKMRLSNRM